MVSPRDDPLDILADDLNKCQLEDESYELPTVISQLSNRCRFLQKKLFLVVYLA